MYILFDIGGTNMRIAASTNGKTFSAPIITPTPKKFTDGIAAFIQSAQKLSKKKKIQAIAGGIAGPINPQKTGLLQGVHLKGWAKKPFTTTLARALGAPVFIENDTAIVGLGEATAGAGVGHAIVAYITVSTGVNGVRIVNGSIDANAFGFEIGHQFITIPDHYAHACPGCASRGDLESFISGSALEKKYHTKPKNISHESVWHRIERLLALGVANTILYWSPHVVVIGGSMMQKTNGIYVPRVAQQVKKIVSIVPHIPPIRQASLQNIGGLHGALAFCRQKLSKK